jgi:hypothetical protein
MPLESPLDKQKGVRAGQYASEQFQRLMADNGVDGIVNLSERRAEERRFF